MHAGFILAPPKTPEEWERYHAIRKQELFDARGRDNYDSNRPEERQPGNFSLLFKAGDVGIGTARLDTRSSDMGVVRLVSITRSEQSKGYGRILMETLEEFAREKGFSKLVLNSAQEAVGFYERLGYVRESWDPSELTGISANSVQMSKSLLT